MPELNFFWDPLSDNILQERDALGALTTEYTTEPGLYGNVISQNRAGVESQFHFDAQGSTFALTSDSAQVTDTYAYVSFGEVLESTGATANLFQYVGLKQYYRDNISGTYLVRRRLYGAARARWLSSDALMYQVLMSLTGHFNQYSYAANAPLIRWDPSGLYEVRIQVDAFIPPAWITLILGTFDLKGDNRDVSSTPRGPSASRVTTIVKVEMERCIRDQDVLTFNHTILSHSTRRFLHTWPPLEQTLLGTYWSKVSASRTGDCDVEVDIATSATIPWLLAPAAPSIDWDLHFDLHVKEYTGQHYIIISGSLNGAHDGFPAYEAYVQDELEYYRRPSWTILALYPPLDVHVGAPILVRDIDKFAKCCECKDTFAE